MVPGASPWPCQDASWIVPGLGKLGSLRQTMNVIKQSLLALVIFIFSFCNAIAMDTFIHATGINPHDLIHNYDEFYSQAVQFQNYCNKRSGTTCINAIDSQTPPTTAAGKALLGQLQGPVVPATKDSILSSLTFALANSKPGDQIFLGLKDHGAPGAGESSCIYLSDKESLCSDEVNAVITKYKKPGVLVMVSADGCFSGGFADLSSKEVCTRVTAPRSKFAYVVPDNTMAFGNYRGLKFSQVMRLTPALDGNEPLSGSQFMLSSMCRSIRTRLGQSKIAYTPIHWLKGKANLCLVNNSSNLENLQDISALANELDSRNLSLQRIFRKLCPDKTDGGVIVCKAISDLLSEQPKAKSHLNQLARIYFNPEYDIKRNKLALADMEKTRQKMLQRPEAQAELKKRKSHPEIYLGKSFGDSKSRFVEEALSHRLTNELADLEEQITLLDQKTASLSSERSRIFKAEFERPELSKFVEDVSLVNTCLAPDAIDITNDEKIYLKDQPPRKGHEFKISDYEEAQKCEQQFTF